MADLTLKKLGEVLDKKLAPIKKKQEEHSQRLDSLVLDMIDVQKKTDLLPDLYSMIKDNKGKIDELEEKVERLESTA